MFIPCHYKLSLKHTETYNLNHASDSRYTPTTTPKREETHKLSHTKKNHKIHQRYENKSTYLCLKSNASDLEQMKGMRKC
jgi:hypothetical protein